VLNTKRQEASESSDTAVARRPGRPNGKRSDSSYVQTSIYLPRAVHSGVMLALAEARYKQSGTVTDFSELVDTLLSEWLNKQQSK
jgi:hypothetical protein